MTVVYAGNYIVILRSFNSDPELQLLGKEMDHYSELGHKVVQSFYENKGVAPVEGALTVIMEYDTVDLEQRRQIERKEGGF